MSDGSLSTNSYHTWEVLLIWIWYNNHHVFHTNVVYSTLVFQQVISMSTVMGTLRCSIPPFFWLFAEPFCGVCLWYCSCMGVDYDDRIGKFWECFWQYWIRSCYKMESLQQLSVTCEDGLLISWMPDGLLLELAKQKVVSRFNLYIDQIVNTACSHTYLQTLNSC